MARKLTVTVNGIPIHIANPQMVEIKTKTFDFKINTLNDKDLKRLAKAFGQFSR